MTQSIFTIFLFVNLFFAFNFNILNPFFYRSSNSFLILLLFFISSIFFNCYFFRLIFRNNVFLVQLFFFPQFCDSFFVLSGFSDLNPRWSGWPRRQTQAVFGTMSWITIMFIAPLTSDHRGFRRYRSLLLLLLFISMVKQGAAK